MPFAKDLKFISPEAIYSRVKEEMQSYFNTGAIDDLMFPVWTKDCIDEFKSTYLPIETAVIDIYNHKAALPCDFKLVREAWVCATVNKGPIQSPFTFYYQTDCRIHPTYEGCSECDPAQCNPPGTTPTSQNIPLPNLCNLNLNNSSCGACAAGDQFRVTHKVQTWMNFQFSIEGMIMPSDYRTMSKCWDHSPNKGCHSYDTFTISGDSIVTSFNNGTLYLLYYADPYEDEDGYYEIPEGDRFGKYLMYYLVYMIYKQLYRQSTDESFNIISKKKDDAEFDMLNARERARQEAMSRNIYDVKKAIVRSYNKNRRFLIR